MDNDYNNQSDYYAYDIDEDDERCYKDFVAKMGSIAVPVFFSSVIVLSLFGNTLVLAILAKYETLNSLTNIFILNLALSDLLFTAGLPFWIYSFIRGWTLGNYMCKGVYLVFYAGFYSSIVFLLLMTIQRYMAVVYPLSDWEKGHRFTRIVPVLAWVVSILLTLPAPITSVIMHDPNDLSSFHCTFNSNKSLFLVTYLQNAFFIVAFLIMSFCYIQILRTVFKSRTNKRHKTIRLIFCIVAVFFVGWAPYNVVIFLKTLTNHQVRYFTDCAVTDHLDYLLYVFEFLAFSHCCMNPVFYVFVGVKFRNHLKGILQKIFQRPSVTSTSRTRTNIIPSQGSIY